MNDINTSIFIFFLNRREFEISWEDYGFLVWQLEGFEGVIHELENRCVHHQAIFLRLPLGATLGVAFKVQEANLDTSNILFLVYKVLHSCSEK